MRREFVDQFVHPGGDGRRVRVAHQIVGADTARDQRCTSVHELRQRQLVLADMDASGAAAAEVHDAVGPSVRRECTADAGHPAPGDVAGAHALRDGVTEHDPERLVAGQRPGRDFTPLQLAMVDLIGDRAGPRADAAQGAGEGAG